MQSTRFRYQILMKLEFSGHIFEKYSNVKFHETFSRGSRVVPCDGQTDGHTDMTILIVSFRNFANAFVKVFQKMTLRAFETLIAVMTQRDVSEHLYLQQHSFENLKSRTESILLVAGYCIGL